MLSIIAQAPTITAVIALGRFIFTGRIFHIIMFAIFGISSAVMNIILGA